MSRQFGLCSALWITTVIALGVPAQAQILTCLPNEPCEPIPPNAILTKSDYLRSVSANWTPSQRSAWEDMDSSFRDEVLVLVWRHEELQEIANRDKASLAQYDAHFRLDMPPNCPIPRYVPPVANPRDEKFIESIHSRASHVVSVGGTFQQMLDPKYARVDDWDDIEPTFKRKAEDALYAEHYGLTEAKSKLAWWRANASTIERCIEDARPKPLTPEELFALNAEDEEENRRSDSYYERAKQWVRDTFGPRQAKPETIQRLDALKEYDRYVHDMDRSEKAGASPSPSPGRDVGPQGSKAKP